MTQIQEYLNFSLPVTDPVLVFAIVMMIILIAPMVFQKIRLPGIVGLILSGTIVGPSVLGLLERDDTMILLGTVGLLYLMFMAGLSIDLNQFSKLRNKSLTFGLLSFFIPQLAAITIGIWLLGYSLATALLLGSVVGSHTLLAYPVAHRLGITKNLGLTMTMGGTIVTDTLSLAVLAVVVASVQGALDAPFWLQFVGLAGIYVAAVLLLVPRLGRWFFRNFRDETSTEYVFLIAVLFLTAWLAELAGLASIIGAFLAGLALNRLVPENSTLMSRVNFVGNALFIPFFLLSVGMLVDVIALLSPQVWIFALAFTGLVLAGKFAAAYLTRLIFQLNSAEGWTMFGLTVPQAAATLAVTLIGYDLGFFDDNAVNAVVIMILVTCLIGPYLVEKFGRQVARLEEKKAYSPSDAPQRIMVPLANPDTSQSLVDIALMIRKKNSDEPLFPITVARDDQNVEAGVADSEKMLSHAVVHAAAADVPVIPATRVDMNIASGIVRAVKELRVTDIVIGWNGDFAPRRRIFGSVLDQVVEQTDELMLVCKIDQPLNSTENILFVVPPMAELEPGFNNAIQTVKTLVQQMGSEITVITTQSNRGIIEEHITNKEPELEAEFETLADWNDIFSSGATRLSSSEMLILFSARNGSVAWQPSLEKLPGFVSRQNTALNFLIMYPSEKSAEEQPSLQIHFERSRKLPNIDNRNITIQLDDISFEDAINSMLKGHFKDDDEGLKHTVSTLLQLHPDNMQGELPGMLLMHTSSRYVNEPTLFLGLSSNGIPHQNFRDPIRVIFILLVPVGFATQRCLSIMGKLARQFRSPDRVSELSQATTIQQIRDLLSASLVFRDTKNTTTDMRKNKAD